MANLKAYFLDRSSPIRRRGRFPCFLLIPSHSRPDTSVRRATNSNAALGDLCTVLRRCHGSESDSHRAGRALPLGPPSSDSCSALGNTNNKNKKKGFVRCQCASLPGGPPPFFFESEKRPSIPSGFSAAMAQGHRCRRAYIGSQSASTIGD
jgi:hypothetical protein